MSRPTYRPYNGPKPEFSKYIDKFVNGGHFGCHKQDYEEKNEKSFQDGRPAKMAANTPSTLEIALYLLNRLL